MNMAAPTQQQHADVRAHPDVVVIPTQGLCNRLRAIASGYVLARHWGTRLYVCWENEPCCKCEMGDVLATPFDTIDLKTVSTTRHLFSPKVHTNQLLLSNPRMEEYDYLVVIGGHEFKHPDMSELTFLSRKHDVYRSLIFAPAVEDRVASFERVHGALDRMVAVHFRDFVPQFDMADNYNFAEVSPIEEFVDIVGRIAKRHPDTIFFLSSNTTLARKALESTVPADRMVCVPSPDRSRDTEAGIVDAVCDLLLLSKCAYIVGTVSSSFSDEACFFRNITKLCVGSSTASAPYHCHGFGNILGCKMLLPDANILLDIYKEGESPAVEVANEKVHHD